MGYFKWRGGFFYRLWHLNAKYYSNGTTVVRSRSECLYIRPTPFSLFLSFPSRYSCLPSMWHRLHRGGDAPGTRGFISWYSNALKHHTRLTRRCQCVARRCHCHGFHVDKRHCEHAALAIETTCDCSLSLRWKNADSRDDAMIMKL